MVKSEEALDSVSDKRDISESRVKEECQASSSSHLKSHFIGMGFSSSMVDKVLNEHGDQDANVILESLLSYSAIQNPSPQSSGSLDGFSDSDDEEKPKFGNNNRDQEEAKPLPGSYAEKRSYLLMMKFSEQEIDMAFGELGETAQIEQLADFIVTAQSARSSKEVRTSEDVPTGPSRVKPEYDGDENDYSTYRSSTRQYTSFSRRTSDNGFLDDEEKVCIKKAKHFSATEGAASSSLKYRQMRLGDCGAGFQWRTNSTNRIGSLTNNNSVKRESDQMISGNRSNVHGDLAEPPYFFYGNVVDVSQDTWRMLSQFLYSITPEFSNSQSFSALIRKEGYIHNLPKENRCVPHPKPPMTIQDALPYTRQWWPSWDSRKQISCILTGDITRVEQICERIGRTLRESRGVLSADQQTHILNQCKSLNLVWVAPDRVSPMEPRQVERVLGYPSNHTQTYSLSSSQRLQALKFSFQIDTLVYVFSVLKGKYPKGIRLMSIYSGIGGAEVALHRLGIHLKCVVSVEVSDENRKVLKKWWSITEQTGELRQIAGTSSLSTQKLEDLWKEFGGFDLIVGANPGIVTQAGSSTNINNTMGMDSSLFFEFVRIVRNIRNLK